MEEQNQAATDATCPWPVWLRIVVSLLVTIHLWAILGRPIEFATGGPTGPSPASTAFYRPVRGYSEFAYLNHGYAFFAPDPGPSHLIRVRLVPAESGTSDLGSQLASDQLTYPDLSRQWPRLLYHRHFMLTEFLHNTYQPRLMPAEIAENPLLANRWRLDRSRHEAILESMASHLRGVTGAKEVMIRRVEHRLVGLPEFLGGQRRLDDPSLYVDLLEVEDQSPIPRFGFPPATDPERGAPPAPGFRFGEQR
jgi:hypothetical protein